MVGYLVRRLFLAVFVLWGVATVVFLIVRVVPADPALLIAGSDAPAEQLAQIRQDLGLDQSLLVQYGRFLGGAVTGDLGQSYSMKQPAVTLIGQVLPNTALLAILACAVALLLAFPLGLVAALRANRALDRVVTTGSLFTQALPNFWIGVVLLLVFSRTLKWLPSVGLDGAKSLILPTIVLALPFVSVLTRMIRNGLLEVMGESYIQTARAKGLPERIVIFRHAIRNAAIPVITIVGLQFGTLLGGAVVTESVFSFPGIGRLLVTSIQLRDYNVVQACVLVIAAVFVIINLVVDLMYGLLDPRVRLAK
ncbi:ABC transporter permease [Cellulomonas chengniuliangii]|uniref:ABC transporter permease n=1 Tax=Cellulomonas chengniuliangii TaxID=2968084 RepID=A0ABY5L7V3_9CELL|nr:ABC transporter permease [Cellulomonas chengniuliangii]MCC2308289.1 ABC transporter permease [Cellulomonas chengniuliangii]MCC2317297.1 ABC transporter permease [Cellulomonas chengniuliangii]UUI76673.1 ABC transporter permease [Cellulomonas chengniuliangii]